MKLQQEGAGIKMDSVLPHLVLVSDDLLSTGIVVYHLKVCNSIYSCMSKIKFFFCIIEKKNSAIFDILFLRLIIII